jgi:hypothetical protein
MDGKGSPATYAAHHIRQAWRRALTILSGTRERPQAMHRARERPRGIPGVPRGGSWVLTVLAHDAGPRMVGRAPLAARAMRRARERPQGIPGSLKEDPRQ